MGVGGPPSCFHFIRKSNPVGALSFALLAKGGLHNCPLTCIWFTSRVRAVHSDSISTVPIARVA
jgi:hypothetical protein